jgi:hypothetical protein
VIECRFDFVVCLALLLGRHRYLVRCRSTDGLIYESERLLNSENEQTPEKQAIVMPYGHENRGLQLFSYAHKQKKFKSGL